MMYVKSLVFAFILVTMNTYGQQFGFNLADYVLPELDYRSSGLSFSGASNGADQQFESDLFGVNQNVDYRISASFGWNSYIYHNSPEKQKIRSNALTFFPSYVYDLNEGPTITQVKTWQLPIFLTSTAIYRKFYRPNRFMQYESKLYSSGRFIDDYQKSGTDIYENNSRSLSLQFDPAVLWGLGRVENVIHASHALKIVEDLAEFKLLSTEVEHQQIMSLADFLAKRDYTRIFDGRIKYAEDLRSLADKIDSIGLVNDRNSTFYASLNDMYLYGVKYGRYAGQSFAFGIKGHFNQQINTQLSLFDIMEYGGGLKAIYQYHKPISQSWQFDLETEFNSLYMAWFSLDEIFSEVDPYLELVGDLQLSIGYYPNTRTEFRSILAASISNRPLLYNILPSEVRSELNSNLTWYNALYYYLSPRAYFSFKLELGYGFYNLNFVGDSINEFSKSRRYFYNSNIGFGYAIY